MPLILYTGTQLSPKGGNLGGAQPPQIIPAHGVRREITYHLYVSCFSICMNTYYGMFRSVSVLLF